MNIEIEEEKEKQKEPEQKTAAPLPLNHNPTWDGTNNYKPKFRISFIFASPLVEVCEENKTRAM